jgi:pyroglutamyl-peptidase
VTRRLRILVTGFGPFPGAPENPTGPLVRALGRNPRAAKDGVTIKAHVFPTRYKAVDRALPRLLKTFKPDALIMFGLATRSRKIRVETLARNRISDHPDAGGSTRGPGAIDAQSERSLKVRAPATALLRALEHAGLPARLSRNAGDYLCNYTLWHATCAAADRTGPKLAAFVHVPPLSTRMNADRLKAAGVAILRAAITATRRR